MKLAIQKVVLLIAPIASSFYTSDAFVPLPYSNWDNTFMRNIARSSTASSHLVEEPSSEKDSVRVVPHKSNMHGSGGLFSPPVLLAKRWLGEKQFNKVRGKVISMHSDVIGKFVETSGTEFGQTVLRELFRYFDRNNNGTIDEQELAAAYAALGFHWLKQKQVEGILHRADMDGNGYLDMREWMEDTPKTLRTNLVKMAKKNGEDMGLLV